MQGTAPLLELKNISKSFPGVKALDDVSVTLYAGEVLALLGENGAGKSTLLKILSGAYKMDSGQILFEGKPIQIQRPSDAQASGISIIYQELNYLPDLCVAENIFLGCLPKTRYGTVDWETLYTQARSALALVGLHIDVRLPMNRLSVMQKQLVEIAKSLRKDMRILIMDEPTSSLNDSEVASLVETVREIAARGVAVVFISHRLDELFLVSDRVAVMRDGKYIGDRATAQTTKNELITMMVGRELSDVANKNAQPGEDVALRVDDFCTGNIHHVNLSIKKGEVLGVFGLMGAGREELAEAIFGLVRTTGGRVVVGDRPVTVRGPADAIRAGIAYVPAERKTDGAVLIQSVRENTTISSLSQVSVMGMISREKELAVTNRWIKSFGTRTPSTETPIESLSGGNQQKVILGRWMQTNPRVLLLNDPTRGVDVGAKAEIYRIIDALCEEGAAVLLISSDMAELLSLSDRIVAMAEGEIKGCLSRGEASQEKLMRFVVGGE